MCLFRVSIKQRKEAFCFYVVGSVLENGFVKHDWFTDANIKTGYPKALMVAAQAFDLIQSSISNYQQKGTLNIYKGQSLTKESKILLDMYEMIMFGDYKSNANENTSYDIKRNLLLRMKSIELILYSNPPFIKELSKNFKNALTECEVADLF